MAVLRSDTTIGGRNVLTELDQKLDISGGTITGNLRLKGSGNYGNILNFGDSDYVHLSEPSDDILEIKAKQVKFVVSDTSDNKITVNGEPLGGAVG